MYKGGGGLSIDFSKVTTFEKLPVFCISMAIYNVIKRLALHQF